MPTIVPFHSEWITFVIIFALIMALIGLSEVLRRRLNISGEHTRQMVHVGVGLLVVTSPFIFRSAVPPAVLALIFIILNLVALQTERLKGMHSTTRTSYGTVFFPLTFLILIGLYWYTDPALLVVGMLIMTIADPAAAVIGTRTRHLRTFTLWHDTKTVQGSLTVFLVTFVIATGVFALARAIDHVTVPGILNLLIIGVCVGIVGMLGEALSRAGSDNLTLPLGSALMLDIMQSLTFREQLAVLGWILLSFLLAYMSYKLKALTRGGAAGAMLLGSIVFSIGGVYWVIPMVTFFILSSILSKIGKLRKTILAGVVAKGSNRDLLQVYANGGVALVMAIVYFYTKQDIFYFMFLGSLAAATADTWGTEIGVFAKRQPIHIVTRKPVPTGTSGGITVLGTSGLCAGAGVLTLSGILPIDYAITLLFIIIAFSGVAGAIVDSILGGTLQAQYSCPQCGKMTEKKAHCGGQSTTLISGHQWIDNDLVNLVCTATGALLVGVLYLLLF